MLYLQCSFVPMKWYSEVLESKYAMRVLAEICVNPGMTKTEVMRLDGGEKTRYVRVNELIEAGLVEARQGDGCANAFALYPTPAGETVGNHIRGINRVMRRRERKGW